MKTFLRFIIHYLNPLNTFFGVLIINAFLSCAFYFSFKNYLGISLSDEIFWSAALGISGFALIKFIETRTNRHNTLCHLEIELNQAMDTLNTLISTLQNMIRRFIPVLMPHDLPCLTMDYVKLVGRLDVKNNLADLLCDFRRINQDWNNLIEFGKGNLPIINDPNHLQHQEIRITGTQLLNLVLQHVTSSLKLIEDTLILVRIYLRSARPFFKFGQPFVWPCKLLINIEEERKRLVAEKQSHQ